MTVFHYDVLLVLVCVSLVARCWSFLGTDAWVELRVAHGELILRNLLLLAGYRILTARYIVHVYFVNIGLILREILLRSRLNSIGAILLVEMQWIISGDVARPSRPHLILWGIPSLLHRWLNYHMTPISIILSNLIALIATHNHLIISSNLLIHAILHLVRLIYISIYLLLLKVYIIIAATRAISS